MKYALLAAALLLGFAAPALAGGGYPPAVEDCDTLDESLALARKMAADHHASVLFLDGDRAHRFLDAIRPPGAKIQIEADHVAVFQAPAFNSSFVMIANNDCGGYGSSFALQPVDTLAALAAAR